MQKKFDVVIVGSGSAGLTFALEAARSHQVAVVTKKRKADSNTAWAQGGIACVTSDHDSIELHVADTLRAGAGLCDEKVVRTIVSEGPERIEALRHLGLHFDERTNEEGGQEPDLGKEGGHTKRRILHTKDKTGWSVEKVLLEAVARHPQIEVFEHHVAIDLITSEKLQQEGENRVVGLYVLDQLSHQVITLQSDHVVLATGGCGRTYLYTTNPAVATGDGVAIAWRAGAKVANMEFMQFHPTCLFHPKAKTFLISEAVRGEGAILTNAAGERFMERYDERLELAPRDVVARAIDAEIKKGGAPSVFLDISHQPAPFLRERFPTIYQTCLHYGIDITKEPIPVVPAAHYQCGGIQTDLEGRSSLQGLYAIGETACTGLHGANRLASNSLLEALVMAYRAARAVEASIKETTEVEEAGGAPVFKEEKGTELPAWEPGQATDVDELVVIYHNWDEIRNLMRDYVGIVRTDKRLARALRRLQNLEEEIEEYYWDFKVTGELLELRNLVTTATLIVRSAMSRKESRGLHFTLDYPEKNDTEFLQDTVLVRGKEE